MKEMLKTIVDEKYYYEKLSNGLEVYLIPNKNVKSFYITFSVKFGSLHTEFKGKNDKKFYKFPNGIAHFLEHQMFEEEKNVSAYEHFSELGSMANAFTTNNVTCYEVFSSNQLKENLEALINYVQNPYFTQEGAKKERGIITEEIKMFDKSPNAEIYFGINPMLFVKDNHRFKISGEAEDIESINEKDLKLCYEYFYHPENMFIIISGNFNPYEAISIIKENQSKKEFPIYKYPFVKTYKEPNSVALVNDTKEMNVVIPKFNISYKVSKKSFSTLDLDDLELELYLKIVFYANFGTTSLFTHELIESELTITPISVSVLETKNHFILGLVTSTNYTEEIIERIKSKISKMEIKKNDFERQIKRIISDYILMFDDIEVANLEMQDDIIKYGKPVDDYIDVLKSLTYDKCLKVMRLISTRDYAIYKIIPFTSESKAGDNYN